MSKSKIILVVLIAIATFALVYIPHINYPMPLHIDEWHHASEAIRMGNYGEYFQYLKMETSVRSTALEMGFQFILFLLSGVANLVLIYKFLPALWAAISGIILFYIVYKKTDSNYFVAILAMLFFASIRSNVNITGILFFTPLTFSIPFIFLFIYFFTEGIQKQKIKLILISLAIMAFLIPIHSISVLFAVPILIIYAALNFKFIIKKIHFFALFLIIPIIGVLLYKYIFQIGWNDVIPQLLNTLQFKYGWGVLEANNALSEVYPIIGYIMAIAGVIFIFVTKQAKKYSFFLIWPLVCLIWIIIYRTTGVSYLSPYQRYLYYLALSLPILSAFGFYHILKLAKKYLNKFLSSSYANKLVTINFHINPKYVKLTTTIILCVTVVIILFSGFNNYYNPPKAFALYHVIDQGDYQAIIFLSAMPKGKVMATPFMSAAVYPISKQTPIANLAFYGNIGDIEKFFLQTDCQQKNEMIRQYDIKYIISPASLDCPFKTIYAQDNNIIYQVNGDKQ